MDDIPPVTVTTQFVIEGGRFSPMTVGRDDVGDLFVKADKDVLYLDDDQARALATTLLQVLK